MGGGGGGEGTGTSQSLSFAPAAQGLHRGPSQSGSTEIIKWVQALGSPKSAFWLTMFSPGLPGDPGKPMGKE